MARHRLGVGSITYAERALEDVQSVLGALPLHNLPRAFLLP